MLACSSIHHVVLQTMTRLYYYVRSYVFFSYFLKKLGIIHQIVAQMVEYPVTQFFYQNVANTKILYSITIQKPITQRNCVKDVEFKTQLTADL